MNKKPAIIIIAILVAISGGVAYLLNSSSPEAGRKETVSKASERRSSKPEATAKNSSTQQGEYLDYTAESFAKASGTRVMFFHAPWCPQCRDLDADIRKSGVPAGVTIFKVDYDTNQNLRQKYGVTIQTTLVSVDNQGGLVNKYVAYEDPSLDAVKRNLLAQ